MAERALRGAVVALVLTLGRMGAALAQTSTCTLDGTAFMTQLFAIPEQELMKQAFMLGLAPPLIGYLAAYGVGLLVNFWND